MDWMRSEIVDRGGSVTFAEFMEMALYHPDRGYYSDRRPRYGREGDFMTAPTVSPWYGRIFAAFLCEIAQSTERLTLVDLAAGDGSFLAAVEEALGPRRASVLKRSIGVERSPAMRARALDRLGGTAEIVAELVCLKPGDGPVVLHASELYDAFAVHRVVAGDGPLEELWVGLDRGELVWERRPAPTPLASYFLDHGVELAPGQVAEVNLAAAPAHRASLEWAGEEGVATILDYGYEAHRLYDSRGRAQGSLACYSGHVFSRDPLKNPGEIDITSHVNWNDLRSPASALGWRELAVWPLAEWLVRAGLGQVAEDHGLGPEAEFNVESYVERQELKRLLDPDGMGVDLKMLVQGKGAIGKAVEELLVNKPFS